LKKKYSLRSISKSLERSVCCISDEIKKNSVNGEYNPIKANLKSYVRRRNSKYQPMKIIKNNQLRDAVDNMLYDDQSPPNIAGRINNHEKQLPNISKDSIYRYIESPYGRQIEYYRSTKKQRRYRRTRSKRLEDRIFINKRPKSIDLRHKIGHIEGDFIVSDKSGKGILLVVVDRKTRYTFLEKIIDVTIDNVHNSFIKIKNRFKEMKTMTLDNDVLFQRHKELETLTKTKIYFCKPYHSWEKGTVENTNKYIRKDIPKRSDISRYSNLFIKCLEDKLNRRSLKCLNYLTPKETLGLERNNKKRNK